MVLQCFILVSIVCIHIGRCQDSQPWNRTLIFTNRLKKKVGPTESPSTSCISQLEALKSAFYAQVDLIRRGLPQTVVEYEYVRAIALLTDGDNSFRETQDLETLCVKENEWGNFFDSSDRAIFALLYLPFIESGYHRDVNFIKFEDQRTLPPLSAAKQTLVDDYWTEAKKCLSSSPRQYHYPYKFSFPSNVEILYDPNQGVACAEYEKFGPITGSDTLDAHTVLIQLLISSIQVNHMGGSRDKIFQMLSHFVAYCFDGIRCLRQEGAELRIPFRLHRAYARHVGFLSAEIKKRSEKPEITEAAIESLFADEIKSLLSYKTWGTTAYPIYTHFDAYPTIHGPIDFILERKTVQSLLTLSARQIQQEKRTLGYNITSPTNHSKINESTHYMACPEGYVYIDWTATITNSYEYCCAGGCKIWSDLLSASGVTCQDCCSRCNAHYCPDMLTSSDIQDVLATIFLVPEYGAQEDRFYQMLVI